MPDQVVSVLLEMINTQAGVFLSGMGAGSIKTLGTGECGDEIELLSHCHNLNPRTDFLKLLSIYEKTANQPQSNVIALPTNLVSKPKPNVRENWLQELKKQLIRLSQLRSISLEGLKYARARGRLEIR